jgi:uncharacterized membrane protein YjjP (DUF1212 family)
LAEDTHLLALAVETGYRLQVSGAEIYRVEEAIQRIFHAYGVDSIQVFAISNCLIVSAIDSAGRPISRMRRIPTHGTDIARMEMVYDFCRRVCQDAPDPEAALRQLREMDKALPQFSLLWQVGGYFLGTGSFALFFGGGPADALAGGVCGVAIGLCLTGMERLGGNLFVRTVIAAFVSAFLALALVRLGVGENANYITIGALMALVPGVVFTNFMRDLMAGDMVAGLIKLVEALLTAGAIAIGTFIAMALAAALWGG